MTRQYTNTKTPVADRDCWRTPKLLFGALMAEFGFTCDVAASNANHLVTPYLTVEDDSLAPETLWGEVNWCNPPYSNITPWVDRAIEEWLRGNTTVMLLPADTSTKWFAKAWRSCNEVRLISGRLSFLNAATGEPVSGNNKGSVLFIWRGNCPGSTHTVSLVERDSMGVRHG